jgi:hypothetical protein
MEPVLEPIRKFREKTLAISDILMDRPITTEKG